MSAVPAQSDAWAGVADVTVQARVDGALRPLEIGGACVLDNRQRYEHCEIAVRAGYPVLVGPGNRTFDAPCVLVGTGPSALALLPEIKQRFVRGEEIIAIKGAHDWLIANGVIPRAAIALDPQQSRAKCFKKPRRDVLYLCASQMHPDTWEHLRGHQVLVWHSLIEAGQQKLPGWEKRFIVPCCSTTGNNAIALLHLMGRRNFELYGYDSSIPPVANRWQALLAKLRGRLLKLDGSRTARDKRVFEIEVAGKRYQTTAELAQQAIELHMLLRFLGDIRVNAHGDGYYQSLLAEGKARGWPV